jgi:hypothetical protein
MIRTILNKYRLKKSKGYAAQLIQEQEAVMQKFFDNGQEPWAEGYAKHKENSIIKAITDKEVILSFRNKEIPSNYGYRLDERVVEYAWVFANLSKEKKNLLDAGGVFNYDFIVNQELIKNKELHILTYEPEAEHFPKNRISYLFADLRNIPIKDNFYDEIACISTIEHIDMDNSIYGWNEDNKVISVEKKSYEYLIAVQEMIRVLKEGGLFLLTFPFGKFENHGFFQQLDTEMVGRIIEYMEKNGQVEQYFFKYENNQWNTSTQDLCKDELSYSPHTGRGKGTDGVAHSRSICCLRFKKS